MNIHNDPIDYAVAVEDERARRLLRERSLQPEPSRRRRVPAPSLGGDSTSGWVLRIVVAEPLIVGAAGSLLGWLVSQGG